MHFEAPEPAQEDQGLVLVVERGDCGDEDAAAVDARDPACARSPRLVGQADLRSLGQHDLRLSPIEMHEALYLHDLALVVPDAGK